MVLLSQTITIKEKTLSNKIEVVNPNKGFLAVDMKKMWRAKETVMTKSKTSLQERIQHEPICGVFFDGKQDKHTKTHIFDEETDRSYPGKVSEEHYTVTWEPPGKYLCHFTAEKPGDGEKAAMMICNGVYTWLCEHGVSDELVLIRADSTSTNTGPLG